MYSSTDLNFFDLSAITNRKIKRVSGKVNNNFATVSQRADTDGRHEGASHGVGSAPRYQKRR
jgi:hypothetical protein